MERRNDLLKRRLEWLEGKARSSSRFPCDRCGVRWCPILAVGRFLTVPPNFGVGQGKPNMKKIQTAIGRSFHRPFASHWGVLGSDGRPVFWDAQGFFFLASALPGTKGAGGMHFCLLKREPLGATKMAVGQHQWYHFGVGAAPILVYVNKKKHKTNVHWGCVILTHGQMKFSLKIWEIRKF